MHGRWIELFHIFLPIFSMVEVVMDFLDNKVNLSNDSLQGMIAKPIPSVFYSPLRKKFKISLIFFTTAFILFKVITNISAFPSNPKNKFIVNQIDSLPSDISSANGHKWYICRKNLDPLIESKRLREGTSRIRWIPIEVPRLNLPESLDINPHDVLWYLYVFEIDSGIQDSLALRLGMINDKDLTFLNGILIGSTGNWNTSFPQGYDKIRIYSLPRDQINFSGKNILLIKVKRFYINRLEDSGLYRDRLELNSSSKLWHSYYRQTYFHSLLSFLYFAFFIYFLIFYFLLRVELYNLYLAIFLLLSSLYTLLNSQFVYWFDIDFLFIKKVKFFILYPLAPVLYLYFRKFLLPSNFLIDRILKFFNLIIPILMLYIVVSDSVQVWNQINQLLYFPIWIINLVAVNVTLVYNIIKKQEHSVILYAFTVIMFALGFLDYLSLSFNLFNLPPMLNYGVISFNAIVIWFALRKSSDLAKENELIKRYNKIIDDKNFLLEKQKSVLELHNNQVKDDLEIARNIQKRLIPQHYPLKSMAVFYQPVYYIGGDFYDFVEYGDGSIGFFICDVSGHGIHASIISSMVKSLFDQYKRAEASPASLLSRINEGILSLAGNNFITAFFGIYHPDQIRMVYSIAGHMPPILLREGKVLELEIRKRSIPLAIYTNEKLLHNDRLYKNEAVELSKGDKLLLYTDGLSEGFNPRRSKDKALVFYGEEKLWNFLQNNSDKECHDLVRLLVRDLQAFQESDEFADDVCILCLGIS